MRRADDEGEGVLVKKYYWVNEGTLKHTYVLVNEPWFFLVLTSGSNTSTNYQRNWR